MHGHNSDTTSPEILGSFMPSKGHVKIARLYSRNLGAFCASERIVAPSTHWPGWACGERLRLGANPAADKYYLRFLRAKLACASSPSSRAAVPALEAPTKGAIEAEAFPAALNISCPGASQPLPECRTDSGIFIRKFIFREVRKGSLFSPRFELMSSSNRSVIQTLRSCHFPW